jgi:hypothetical protein
VPADELDREVRILVERLRTMSTTKLASRLVPGDRMSPSRADAARHLAQRISEAAQALEADGPAWRVLPDLTDLAVGDQLAVTAHDLHAALLGHLAPQVATRNGVRPLAEVLDALLVEARELRRTL